MNTHEIYHIHDNFVRQMLARTIIHTPFVQYYIQPRLAYQIDLANLQSAMNDVSSELLQELRIDFVLKTTIKDKSSITIYLVFEHKSEYDAGVFSQAGRYCEVLKKDFEANHPGQLNDVVPVIIYHGSKKWNVLAHGSNLHIKGQHFIQRYEFFDISHTPDDKLIGPPQLRLVLLMLKYVSSPQIVHKLHELFVLIKETREKVSIDPAFFNAILRYLKYASLPGLKEGVMKKIEEFRGSWDTQDIDLYLRKEDFEKGEKLGLEKGEKLGFEKTATAIAMIKNKENDVKIMKETGLSTEEITRLRKLIER